MPSTNFTSNNLQYQRNRVWLPSLRTYYNNRINTDWNNLVDYRFNVPTYSDWRWVPEPQYSVQPEGQWFRHFQRNPRWVNGTERYIKSGGNLFVADSNTERLQELDPSVQKTWEKMQKEINIFANGNIQKDDRNEKAQKVWGEINSYATQPNFAENMQKLIQRRKDENPKIFSYGEFGPENPSKPRSREESLSELENFLQNQINSNIKDVKVVESVPASQQQTSFNPDLPKSLQEIWN